MFPAPSCGGTASRRIFGRQAGPAVAPRGISRCRPVVSLPRPTSSIPRCLHPSTSPPSRSKLMSGLATGPYLVPPRPRACRAASPRLPRRVRRLPWGFPAGARRSGAHGGVVVVIVLVKRSDSKLLFWFCHSTQSKTTLKTGHSTQVARSERAGSTFLRSSSVDLGTQRAR